MLLRSIVVDYLEQEHRREKTGVAYVFCMHNGANQTASNYLGSSLRQLARQNAAILEDIKSCHRHHTRYETRPSLNEFATLLRLQVEKFDEVFIVIDALDECPEHDQVRKSFLAELRALLPKVSLMVTSRDVPSIENMFKHDIRLEIRARDQDIRGFIKSQMEQRDGLVELLEGHSDVQSTIIATVLEKTNGMLVSHQVSIASKLTKRKVPDCSVAHGFSCQRRQYSGTQGKSPTPAHGSRQDIR